ncbi:unnamed protein product [Didymodactylos carnosus]|uniref:Uncharacterized protein n=1 Tax=Didymodactylos carnosus TaxID=1234261 RepID=A0A815QK51_9BILA|nr:unnamed protein product [Didymodactylos carnosus]CAF4333860.1 unnamed protein product [Didymodactylos carnosus]
MYCPALHSLRTDDVQYDFETQNELRSLQVQRQLQPRRLLLQLRLLRRRVSTPFNLIPVLAVGLALLVAFATLVAFTAWVCYCCRQCPFHHFKCKKRRIKWRRKFSDARPRTSTNDQEPSQRARHESLPKYSSVLLKFHVIDKTERPPAPYRVRDITINTPSPLQNYQVTDKTHIVSRTDVSERFSDTGRLTSNTSVSFDLNGNVGYSLANVHV